LRYFNAAGASVDGSHGEDPTASESLVPVAIRAAVRRRPIDVFGTDYPTPDGTAIRDYVHIVDLAEAHVHAIDFLAQHQRSVTANLGTGQGTSVTQVLDAVRRITGIDVPIRARPRRQGDIPAIWADTSFARQTLGWRPRMQIDEIVLTTWRWFLRSEQRGLRSSAKASEPSPARASCET
jgi:UDP-glucose 4-epimerase